MMMAFSTDAPRRALRQAPAFAALALALFAATSALAQVPSMMGAPGLSPAPPDMAAPMQAPGLAPPPAMSAPEAAPAPTGCEADMMKFQERRNSAISQINAMVKGGKKKLDPVAACPKFRNLAAVENEMKNWMLKNKDWCSIPDEVVDNMKAGFARTPQIANQACNAAAQMRKMQQQGGQQARGGAGPAPAVKLPSGPL
jgi:hypothetical protein